MGQRILKGEGLTRNKSEAYRHFSLAAEQGCADAQFLMAEGCRQAQDADDAYYYFRRAAKLNHAEAQSDLGTCFFPVYGVSLTQNLDETHRYYRLSADQGCA